MKVIKNKTKLKTKLKAKLKPKKFYLPSLSLALYITYIYIYILHSGGSKRIEWVSKLNLV